MAESSRLPIVKLAAGTAVVASTAALAYYLLKKSPRQEKGFANLSPQEKALLLKDKGNAFFAKQQYNEAEDCFKQSIAILREQVISPEQQQLLSTVFNNLSAAAEYKGDLNEALEFSSRALEINKSYTKVYVRRARLFKKKGDLDKAVSDEGYAMRLIANPSDKLFAKLNRDFMEDLAKLSADHAEIVYKKFLSGGEFLPISRLTVNEWTQKLAIHDPLLERMDKIQPDSENTSPLELAMVRFKKAEFDTALEAAVTGSLESDNVVDLLLSRLLACRLYFFAGLLSEMEFMSQAFEQLWDNQTEEFKVENRNILLAFWSMRVNVDDVFTSEHKLIQNKELMTENVDPLVVLANHCSRWTDHEKAIALIQLAKTLEPSHPDLEFQELVFTFYNAAKSQNIGSLHIVTANLDRYIANNSLNGYKAITAAKVFASCANLDLAVEVLEKNKDQSNDSVAYDLFHLLCYTEKNDRDPAIMKEFPVKLSALAKADPHNSEVLSLLSRSLNENGKFFEASELALLALRGARFLQEFTIRYQDVLASFAFAGRDLPLSELPPYKGPKFIKVTSDAYASRFLPSEPDVV